MPSSILLMLWCFLTFIVVNGRSRSGILLLAVFFVWSFDCFAVVFGQHPRVFFSVAKMKYIHFYVALPGRGLVKVGY